MKKINDKGFTLIELLAVIVIMGILMMVAIPAVSRTIENSRKDTFVDVAKQYANQVKTLWAADGLECKPLTETDESKYVVSSAVDAGTASNPKYYYVVIDTANSDDYPVLLEQGGKSSWGNKNVTGYVKVKVDGNYKYGVVDNLDPVTVKFDDGTRDSFCMGKVIEISSYEYLNERCKSTIHK